MKTIYTSLIIMSLATCTVNGQTSNQYSVREVLGTNNSTKTFGLSASPLPQKKYYAEISLEEFLSYDKVASGKTEYETVKLAQAYCKKLQQQGEEFSSKELQLKLLAKTKSGEEQKMVLDEADELGQMAGQQLVRSSEIRGKINRYHYSRNKSHYLKLSVSSKAAKVLILKAESMYLDAERYMRMGMEMREEAYAQTTLATKLGTLGNADATEQTALYKQNQAIVLLEHAIIP